MRVGVTGARGYVGRALVRRLLAAGHGVVTFDRGTGEPPGDGVTALRGDIRDPSALTALASATDAVVHAAAYVHREAATARTRAECFAVNEGGTRALVAAMTATGRRPHLVFVSSTAVYGARFTRATEATPPRPITAYGESKRAAEDAVLEAIRSGAITGCVLRPTVVYGAGAPGNTARLLGLIRRGLVPSVRGGSNTKSMVHVDDLAEVARLAVERADAVNGRTYNVAGPAVSVREMVTAIAAGAGERVRWLPVPGALAEAAASASSALARVAGGRVPDLSRPIEAFAGEASVDASNVERDLGFAFRPTVAALTETAREWSRPRV